MSADSFSEISSSSWFGRIGSSFKGIFAGMVLIVIAVLLLTWNEGRAVKRYQSLKEGAGAVISVSSDRVDQGNEGKLVHVSGLARTDDQPHDADFGVTAHALNLSRKVEMYQWKEAKSSKTEKKLGGGTETVTTYTYSKEWSSQRIDSAKFKEPAGHQNPADMRFSSKDFIAKPVTLGAFTLASKQVGMMGGGEGYSLPEGYQPPADLGEIKRSSSMLYIGKDSAQPGVGDLRISFSIVPEQEVSVVAAQIGNSFQAYQTKAGGTIHLLENGMLGADAMIQVAQEGNRVLTWALRGVGLLFMFIGFSMMLAPLSVLADVIPFIGNLVEAGTAIIAFLATCCVGLTTIAIAWIVFRPLLGVGLLVLGGGVAYLVYSKMKSSKAGA